MTTPQELDERFRAQLAGLTPTTVIRDLDGPVRDGTALTGAQARTLYDAQSASRHLDLAARWLQSFDAGYYTIGSSGHEGNAAVAMALRPTDPALLHYRSGGFYCTRAAQLGTTDPIRDVLRGVVASAKEPIAGGRHKVFGHSDLHIIPTTSTIASHLPRAVGIAYALGRGRRRNPPVGNGYGWPPDAIVATSFGDASINHAAATASFNTAGWCDHTGLRLPLLMICEDNGLGISVRSPAGWVEAALGSRPGLRYFTADGLDVATTYDVTSEAADWVRRHRRPAVVHLTMVRLMGHAGADAEIAYRTPAEINADVQADPLVHTARLIVAAGLASPAELMARYDELGWEVRRIAEEVLSEPKLASASEVTAPLAPRRPVRVSRAVADAAVRLVEAADPAFPEDDEYTLTDPYLPETSDLPDGPGQPQRSGQPQGSDGTDGSDLSGGSVLSEGSASSARSGRGHIPSQGLLPPPDQPTIRADGTSADQPTIRADGTSADGTSADGTSADRIGADRIGADRIGADGAGADDFTGEPDLRVESEIGPDDLIDESAISDISERSSGSHRGSSGSRGWASSAGEVSASVGEASTITGAHNGSSRAGVPEPRRAADRDLGVPDVTDEPEILAVPDITDEPGAPDRPGDLNARVNGVDPVDLSGSAELPGPVPASHSAEHPTSARHALDEDWPEPEQRVVPEPEPAVVAAGAGDSEGAGGPGRVGRGSEAGLGSGAAEEGAGGGTPEKVSRVLTRDDVFRGRLPELAGPLTLAQTINAALTDAMLAYPQMLVFGEDVAAKGGVYGVTKGLRDRFPGPRVFDTLLDETSILGLALGTGLAGLLPVPEIQYLAYLHNAEDQLRGEAATMQFFSQGAYHNPMVVRVAGLGYQRGFGGHFHNDNALAVLRDIPGLVVAAPTRAEDAAAMLRTCLASAVVDGSVCVFLEPIALYHTRDLHTEGDERWLGRYAAPERWASAHVPIGRARGYSTGPTDDLTIITFGNGVPLSLRAANRLAADGIGARVVDLRWLSPLPVADIIREATATGRVLVVDETRRSGGVGEGVIAALVDAGYVGVARRVAAVDSFIPLGPAAAHVLVSEEQIVQGARSLLAR